MAIFIIRPMPPEPPRKSKATGFLIVVAVVFVMWCVDECDKGKKAGQTAPAPTPTYSEPADTPAAGNGGGARRAVGGR